MDGTIDLFVENLNDKIDADTQYDKDEFDCLLLFI